MSKRVDAAIAIIETARAKIAGAPATMLDAALELLRPTADTLRKRRQRPGNVPDISTEVSKDISTDKSAETSDVATPDPGLVPSQRQKGTRKDPKASSSLSLLSPAVTDPSSYDVRAAVWRSYSHSYQRRYRGVAPTRNAKVNGQIRQFCDRVPAEDAVGIADFYVRSNNARYVAAGHSIGCLLQDAEKLRTEYLAGAQMTQTRAREIDKSTDRENRLEAVRARLQAEDDAAALEANDG